MSDSEAEGEETPTSRVTDETRTPDDTGPTFYEDWENGRNGWTDYVSEGNGFSEVRSLSSPDGGSRVLTVSQSRGGGTEQIVGTEQAFAGWDGQWTLKTLVHTTALDPTVDSQDATIIPNYDPAADWKDSVALRLGVKGGGRERPIEFQFSYAFVEFTTL